jgi:hypothetical protein
MLKGLKTTAENQHRTPGAPLDLTTVSYRRRYEGFHGKELQMYSRSSATDTRKEVEQHHAGSCDGKEVLIRMPDKRIERWANAWKC